MRKSDKKLDNEIRKVLTNICDNQLKSYEGFEWITHRVNYSNFPSSLKVVCVFDNNDQIAQLIQSNYDTKITSIISKALSGLGIKLPTKFLEFDTEENCWRDNRGNWQSRLS